MLWLIVDTEKSEKTNIEIFYDKIMEGEQVAVNTVGLDEQNYKKDPAKFDRSGYTHCTQYEGTLFAKSYPFSGRRMGSRVL